MLTIHKLRSPVVPDLLFHYSLFFKCLNMHQIMFSQEFSSDMGCRPVKRIADVSRLRNFQFPQVLFLSPALSNNLRLFICFCLITYI